MGDGLLQSMDAENAQSPTATRAEVPQGDDRPWWSRLLRSPTLWIFLALSIVGAVLIDWIDTLGGPVAFRQRFGLLAPVLTVTLHIVLALTPFPSDAVSIANGAMYGFQIGVSLSWFGWWLAALAEFALGRRARIDFCLDTALAKSPRWVQRFPVSHPAYLILSRQIPWLGGHISTFVPGAAGVSWRRYAWCSAIAIIPGALVMTGIGVGIMRLQ